MTPGRSFRNLSPLLLALAVLCILLVLIIAAFSLSSISAAPADGAVHVKILAVNDFHGQLPDGQKLNGEPAGGIPVLASYLKKAMTDAADETVFLALPGDIVGASPPESGLLLDEPSMLFFNGFANRCCDTSSSCSASCNLVATLGNHEFDKGTAELMRKIYGGNGNTNITHLVDSYPGTKASYVCCNVVWKVNQTTIVPPYVIRDAGGSRIAFIGADTIQTPSIEMPQNVADVIFLNESASINRYIPGIQEQGVHAIVVLLHEGGTQDAYTGLTRDNTTVSGRVVEIVACLDPDVDVVLSAHTHEFTNAYLNNSGSNQVLVTQAYSYSRAFADVDLTIDPLTGEITEKTARIVPAYANIPPGTDPDPEASAFLALDKEVVSPMTSRLIAVAATDITREQDDAGESVLGDLVADAQRAAMNADLAFITTGSLRADISCGNVTWGNLYAVQPFSATVLSMSLSGEEIKKVLEQQWETPLPPHNLGVSGLTYSFDTSRPVGDRVTEILINGVPIDYRKQYTAAMVDYLATGGDGYTIFTKGTNLIYGPTDIDALVSYMGSLPQPVNVTLGGRITRVA